MILSSITQELVSDTLSRSYLNNIKPEFDENTLIWYIHFNLLNLPISLSQLDLFYLETQKDQIYKPLFVTLLMVGKKSINTERVTSLLLPPQWNYVPWTNSFEEPKRHSGYHTLLWNEVDYPSRTFWTWKCEKTCPSNPVWATNSEIEDMVKNCPKCFVTDNPVNPWLSTQLHKNLGPNSLQTYFYCMGTIIYW